MGAIRPRNVLGANAHGGQPIPLFILPNSNVFYDSCVMLLQLAKKVLVPADSLPAGFRCLCPKYTHSVAEVRFWPMFSSLPHMHRLLQTRLAHHPAKPGDRVMVAMSGGVDSSVTAALLKQRGCHVQGIYMRNWDSADERGVCTSNEDWEDVQRVCDMLKIDCTQVNFVKEYWTDVFEQTLDDYAHGLTPNPDVQCNRHIKFGHLLQHVPANTLLATGHYCRTHQGRLFRGNDRRKDQSYFLSAVSSEALRRTVFPLGEFDSKAQVKAIARQLGLHVAQKRESMGICFVGQRRRFADFLAEYIKQEPGPAVDLDGNVIGQHQGLFGYTVGQASRICHGSHKWFVAHKRIADNTLVCVPGSTHPQLFHSALTARDWVWIEGRPPFAADGVLVDAQVRYRMAPQKALLSALDDGRLHLKFMDPIRAMAPGQQVAVYRDDWCLGSGVIQDIFSL